MMKLWITFRLCKLNYNDQFYLVKHFNQLKLRYVDPCYFLTKGALVSQPTTLVVAKDSNISHNLNLTMFLPMIILAIIWYTPNMIVLYKCTQNWRYLINSLSLVDVLLLIIKILFIYEG